MAIKKTPIPVAVPTTGLATVRETAEYLRVSIDTIYRMIRDNELKSHRVRDAIRIPWEAIHGL